MSIYMKTIFITIRDGEISKNILRSSVFPLLKEKCQIVLFVTKNKVEYFRKELAAATVFVETIPDSTFPRLERWFENIFLYSLHTGSILVKIDYSYFAGGSLWGRLIKRILWFFGQFYVYRQGVRFLYRLIPDRSFLQHFKKYQPVLVLAANLIANEDLRLIKAARFFGIKSVGMPKGWDNFTLKTFLGVAPDWLLVPTPLMKSDAIKFLDYPAGRITVTGFPRFDVYADRSKILPREQFLKSLGLDPNKKTILYAGAGDQLAPHDEEVLRDLLSKTSAQVIVRPHPKYHYRSEIIRPSSNWVLDRPGRVVGAKEGDFEFEEEDMTHLLNTLVHCDLLIHTASTLGIEAAFFDKPSISIAFDGDAHPRPERSVARYYKYVHLKRVAATGGMKIANNFQELLDYTDQYLKNPSLDRAKRKILIEENVGIIDGRAGKRIADFVLTELQ